MWDDLKAQYDDQIDLIEVDRDDPDGREFAESHGIFYQPGFVVYDESGELLYEGLGPYTGDEMTELVLSVLDE